MDLKSRKQIQGYTISTINNTFYMIIYRMGLSEPSLTTITEPFIKYQNTP